LVLKSFTLDHVLDRGLHVDDARGIDSDQVMSSGQVIDGCRFGKSTKMEIFVVLQTFFRPICVVHLMWEM